MQIQINLAGSFTFPGTSMIVNRMGYGAMQLAGPGVFGPPRDVNEAVLVLREAVDAGVNHIDTSDYYGPHVTNQIIKQALHPYSDGLVIVTKLGARRGDDKSWIPALSRQELMDGTHDNLRNLGLNRLDVVNLRVGGFQEPSEGSIEEPLTALAELKSQGLIRHIGLSNVSPTQYAEAQKITDIVCVQNFYNVAHRDDDNFIDQLAGKGVAYVPFFPLGRIHSVAIVGSQPSGRITRGNSYAACAGLAFAALTQYFADPGNIFGRAPARKPSGCSPRDSC